MAAVFSLVVGAALVVLNVITRRRRLVAPDDGDHVSGKWLIDHVYTDGKTHGTR